MRNIATKLVLIWNVERVFRIKVAAQNRIFFEKSLYLNKTFEVMAQELLNKQIMWYKSKLQAFAGKMVVTEDQFTFSKPPKWSLAFGALGALAGAASKGKPMIDDKIVNLKFSKGRDMGKKNYMLNVTDASGKDYDFLVDDKIMESIKAVIKLEEVAEA